MLRLPTESILGRKEKIMAEWIEKSLGEIAEITKLAGFEFTKYIEYNNDGEVIALRALNLRNGELDLTDIKRISRKVSDGLTRSKIYKDDILLTYTGNGYGDCAIIEENDKYHLAPNICKIVPNKNVVFPYYLYCYIRSKAFYNQMSNNMTGSGQPTIPMKTIRLLKIPVPEMRVQVNIANMLWLLNQKRRNNKVINNNLEQQVSVLYQSWFEDFEITNGICPENWSYQELSTIADIASGKRPPVKSDTCNEKTPISIVGAASVMGFTSEANHTDKILVTGRVGTHGVIQRFNTPCWTSDNTLVITSPYYEFTNQILHRIDYSSMNRGSTQPLITQGDMKKVVVLVPDEDALAKFEEFAGSLMAKWEANNNENVKLASLRDTLLPKLMSGELDVSGIDL